MVYGTNGYCTSPTFDKSDGCTTWRGGQYDKVASTTRKFVDSKTRPGDSGLYPVMDFVADTVSISGNISLHDVPLGIPLADWNQQGYHPLMAFGLGKKSTILSALISSGDIVSRTWSMFYGWTGDTVRSQLDGTFVFGGYDKAKVVGDGFSIAMTDNEACDSGLMVTIEDMILNFPNGTTESLFEFSSDSISACIMPDYPVLMTIPLDPYFNKFQNLTDTWLDDRSFGLAYYSMLYSSDDEPYQGDLTFKIQSGPSIRISNDQLVVSEKKVDSSTGALASNATSRNLILNPVQQINAKDMPKLGRQFLSAAYLMVNQDAQRFTLWPANPTNAQELVAIDKDGQEVTEFCAEGKSTPSASTETSRPSSTTSATAGASSNATSPGSTSSSSVPLTTIVGIAAGSVTGIILIVLAVWCLYRRRRVNKVTDPDNRPEPVPMCTSNGQRRDSRDLPPGYGWDKSGTPLPVTNYAELPHQQHLRDGYWKAELHGSHPKPWRKSSRKSEQYEMAG